MISNKKIGIGLIGLGYWGANILRNLYEMGAVCSACDVDQNIIRERERVFHGIKYVQRYKDIMSDPKIDAVVIATPAVTHYALVKEALEANKDVFVEKPLALNLSHGRDLVRITEERKRILMVGHILQYHPALIKLNALIADGKLGKVQYIYSNRLNIGRLRVEENILWSFAPHDISAILMLIDNEPLRVDCFGEEYISKGVYDTTLTTLEFPWNIKAHIFVSWLHPFKEQKLVVIGSKAMAVFDDLSEEKLFIYPHKIEWGNGKVPIARKAEYEVIKVDKKEPLAQELAHFIVCLQHRKKPRTDGDEGLRVLQVLELAENSLKEHKRAQEKEYFFCP